MKTQQSKLKTQNLANFLFEAATLKRLQRTGWQILGENEESIASHSFMVTVISSLLAYSLKANRERVILMSLYHDFPETRTGDIYKLADKYVTAQAEKAATDAFSQAPNRDELEKLFLEYEQENTLAAKIVHDADTLAICLELKQLMERGNKDAGEWFSSNKKALHLDKSKKLIDEIEKTSSQNWWKMERDELHRNFGKRREK